MSILVVLSAFVFLIYHLLIHRKIIRCVWSDGPDCTFSLEYLISPVQSTMRGGRPTYDGRAFFLRPWVITIWFHLQLACLLREIGMIPDEKYGVLYGPVSAIRKRKERKEKHYARL